MYDEIKQDGPVEIFPVVMDKKGPAYDFEVVVERVEEELDAPLDPKDLSAPERADDSEDESSGGEQTPQEPPVPSEPASPSTETPPPSEPVTTEPKEEDDELKELLGATPTPQIPTPPPAIPAPAVKGSTRSKASESGTPTS